jgi:hypothetical protein
LLYKDAVTAIQGIAPVSQSWAKKHVLGFSDEEIRLDIQQQRIEMAVAKELENTATVITKTGIFDNIDKLYGGSSSGSTAPAGEEGGAGLPPEPSGLGAPPETGGEAPEAAPEAAPPAGPEVQPESKKENLNILLESDDMLTEDSFIDLSRGRNYLGDIEDELNKLLNS